MPDLPLDDPVRFHMEPGDLFFVASDGFAEAANADKDMFGNDRIVDLLRANRDQSSQETLDCIMSTVAQFTDHAPADDDRTGVLIRRC
jgi:sigma-B regulation protein RsbU (phosphoserine phosphatase)